jgi:RNA polymerase sigma factor (sigma-70 family)
MTPESRSSERVLPPFERVVELHGPALLRFCAARVGPARAEDCFQESMLAALRAYSSLRDADAIRPWLFSIAVRKAIDMHRAETRTPDANGEIDDVVATEPPARRDESLESRLASLPEKQRQAVTLRYFGELSHKEIAAIMETSEDAARRNVFEGLNRLRGELAR